MQAGTTTSVDYSTNSKIEPKGLHSYIRLFDRFNAMKIRNRIKLQATKTLQNPSENFSSEVANSSRAVISNIGSTVQISQLINYRISSMTSAGNIEIADLGLASQLLTTHRGTSFYQ